MSSVRTTLADLNRSRPPIIETLGGELVNFDSQTRTLNMRYDIDESLCHSGNIVQGGIVTAMLDATMVHAIMVSQGQRSGLPTIDIHVSFLRASLAGQFSARGTIVKMGRRVVYTSAQLFDANETLTATATASTVADFEPR